MLLYYAICIPERCSSASLLLPHCSSVLLLCHCSAAQVQLVGLCNHWVRLHSCTLHVLLLWLGLGWRVQTFFVSLSWVSISWVPWLGYLEQVFPWKLIKLSKFTSCSCISPLIEKIVEKSSRNIGKYRNLWWNDGPSLRVFMRYPNNNPGNYCKSISLKTAQQT